MWQDARKLVLEDLEHSEVLSGIERFAEEELGPQLGLG
jgi:hypothetical protein